ncbi:MULTISPECIES: hypothetical protein [Cupriavidus]|uniref:hypothetical protein n=1 Tax=Cupriavidus sp. DF5525 TaxID=3160989 RepID=UPI0032DF8372
MERTAILAGVLTGVLAYVVLHLRRRYQLFFQSHLLLHGLVLTPVAGNQVKLVGYREGRDISGVVPAADIFYKIESHPKKKVNHWNPDHIFSAWVNDWDAPRFSVQLYRSGEVIWAREVPRSEALRVREAVESLRKRASVARTGDKESHVLDLLWMDRG